MRVYTDNGIRIEHEKLAEKFTNISNFSQRQAEVFILRKIAELSVEETAEEMGIGTGSVSEYSRRYREKFSDADSLLSLKERYS